MSQVGRIFTNSGPGGFIQTLTSNVGGPIPPTGGNINVIGGNNITGTGNAGTSTITFDLTGTTNHSLQIGNASGSLTSLAVASNGQIPIGSVGANPVIANITPGSGITISNGPGSIQISASGSVATTYTEDSGSATPALGNLNIFGAHGINTLGAGSTVTIAVNNTLTLGDLAPVVGSSLTLTSGDETITAGNLNLPNTVVAGTAGEIKVGGTLYFNNFGTGGSNTFLGPNAGNVNVANTGGANNGFGAAVMGMITSGLDNTGMGHVAFQVLSTGSSNCAFGGGALNGLTTGSQNVAVGLNAAEFVQTGSNNTALGFNAGNSWGIASANNINIGNVGASESATIRIGTNATHTNTYIAGIDGVNVGSVAKVLTMASDHIGTATIVAGTGVTVTAGANTITIAATGTTSLTYTNVSTTPYVVLTTDEYLCVDTSALAITIQLPNAATLGRVFIIKDRSGAAATRNITVTTVGGAVNIDGATSFVMNTNFQSIQVIGNGSTYEVF